MLFVMFGHFTCLFIVTYVFIMKNITSGISLKHHVCNHICTFLSTSLIFFLTGKKQSVKRACYIHGF